jgi:hypothetical protein
MNRPPLSVEALAFRDALFSFWTAACERWEGREGQPEGFAAWSGATKDVLLGFGMRWDRSVDGGVYTFEPEPE